MRCLDHLDSDVVSVCVHCGRALCGACLRRSANDRCVCSAACAATSEEFDRVLGTSRQVNRQVLFVTALFMDGFAAIIAVPALWLQMQGAQGLAILSGCFAAVIALGGIGLHLAAARLNDETPTPPD